jgi:hypothetical protein
MRIMNLTAVPVRRLFVWALLGYVALVVLFTLVGWLAPDGGGTLVDRAAGSDFTTLVTVGLPVVSVLLATEVRPTLPESRMVALVAVAMYGVILAFGSVTFLLGLGKLDDALDALRYVVIGVAELALAALAGYYALLKAR